MAAESYKVNSSGFAPYATPADLIEYRDWRLIGDLIRDDDKRAANIYEITGSNEIQTLTVDATGGTYTLTWNGQTTSSIAYNASAATVQAALELLSNIGEGDVGVSGGPGSAGGGSPYLIEFIGSLAGVGQSSFSTSSSLTGGAGTASVSTTTQASDGNTRVVRALKTATGMIESEIFHGGRYSRADMKRLLALIADPDDDDATKYTMARDMIRQLTCDLAFWILIKRRKPDVVAEKIAGVKEAFETLLRLRNGEAILVFDETTEAGVMDIAMLDPYTSRADYESRKPFRASVGSTRLFGKRANGQ